MEIQAVGVIGAGVMGAGVAGSAFLSRDRAKDAAGRSVVAQPVSESDDSCGHRSRGDRAHGMFAGYGIPGDRADRAAVRFRVVCAGVFCGSPPSSRVRGFCRDNSGN